MNARCATHVGVALTHRVLDDLAARLDIALPPEARAGADLLVRARRGGPWPAPAPLLRAADGWIHPGPPTAWSEFVDVVTALGAAWPDLDALTVDQLEAEAAAWRLPVAAVRTTPAAADPLPAVRATRLDAPSVVLLGTAWATPLAGRVLSILGARVTKVEHPHRPDPFPLRDDLVRGQQVVGLDLGVAPDRDACRALVERADLVVVGHPPRVLANAGIEPPRRVLRIAAFADSDRPGYGPGAEARGGWAARHDPPRLGRTSVADPVAGMVAALTAVHLLQGASDAQARVSLEGAVGLLLESERDGG
jgi:hypothetical protein